MAKFCYLRLYLGIETVSCRLLQGMVTIVMDWNLKKLGQFLLPSAPRPRSPCPSPLSELLEQAIRPLK